MNGAFLHLAFNHIPVVGVPLCFFVLAVGLCRKSRDVIGTGFATLVIVALLTIMAYKTGGPAARLVRNVPGIVRAQIHEHAEAADDAFVALEILGGAALLGLWLCRRPDGPPKVLTALILIGTLGMTGWFGWVAHLGGLIRHPEIGSGFIPPTAPLAGAMVPEHH